MPDELLIRVHRDERDVGYFTPETALECLQNGILRPDDWAYCEGLNDWTPLEQLLEVPAVFVTPPPVPALKPSPSPPPIPAQSSAQTLPLITPIDRPPATDKGRMTAFVAAGLAVCVYGIPFIVDLFRSSPSGSPSGHSTTPVSVSEPESRQDKTSGLLPPLTGFDGNAEPIEAVPELGMSAADVANFREWLAAGSPRYWKGKDKFPGMSNEQWEKLRRSTRESLERIESGKR